MRANKILLTGAAGFIGMHTVSALIRRGQNVIGVDSINNYYDPKLKLDRLAQNGIDQDFQSSHSLFSFRKMDLANKDDVLQLFEKEQFTQVIHLAAQPGIRYSLENPDAYIESNISGFMNLLEACRKFPPKHLVFASSSSVYGLNQSIPFSEDQPTEHPISLYAATKKSNEMLAHTYAHLFNIPMTGLRFFTVYGPWGRPDMAPFLFTDRIAKGETIKVFNHGKMQRDFTFVNDIVSGILKVLQFPPSNNLSEKALLPNESPSPYQIFNIGLGEPIQLMDFIAEIENALGKKAKIEFHPLQPGDLVQTFASTQALEQLTGYKPQTSLREGIRQYVDWYKSYYQ